MKKIPTFILILCAMSSQAQYFQQWYNLTTIVPGIRDEKFSDGLRSRVNYSGGIPANYYNVGYGTSFLLPSPVPTGISDDVRFVRTNKTGATIAVNNGYTFANAGTMLWGNAHGSGITEIANTAGTGGYIGVGNLANNVITGATYPGTSDALFTRINNAGVVATRFRCDYKSGLDGYTNVIRSVYSPSTYYVCGFSGHGTYTDAIVMAITSNGVVIWNHVFQFDATWTPGTPPSAHCKAFALREDALSGTLIVVGTYEDLTPPLGLGIDGLVFALAPSGFPLWIQHHHVAGDDQYHDVIQLADGNFLLCGFNNFDTGGIPFYDVWLTKISLGGAIISSVKQRHGAIGAASESKGYSEFSRINTSNVEEVFVAGPHYSSAGTITCAVTKTIGGIGASVAWYDYASQGYDDAYGIDYADAAATRPGAIVFSSTNAPAATAPYNDSYFLKTYFNGATCTNYCPANPLTIVSLPVAVSQLPSQVDSTFKKNILDVTQRYYTYGLICSQLVITCGSNARYDDGNTIQESFADQMVQLETGEMLVYPNPAADLLNVGVVFSNEADYHVQAIDVTGRVYELSDQFFNEGNQLTQLDISDLSNGVYTLRITDGVHQYLKKFVKQ